MTAYAPEAPPITLDAELQEYLNRELNRIGDAVQRTNEVVLTPTNVAPTKPEEGSIIYADGVNFNPNGEGEGVYVYVNGAWVKLSVGIAGINTLIDTIAGHFTGRLYGLTLSNNATDAVNDIDIAIGNARNSTDTTTMVLSAAMGKRLDAAWAAGGTPGASVGGRMSAAAIADTTYHVHLIKNPTTGLVDVGFDVSATAPTLPAGYTLFRRIGSVLREAGALVLFRQTDDYFHRVTTVGDRNSAVATADTLLTLSVPIGIRVVPLLEVRMSIAGGANSANFQLGSGDFTLIQALVVQATSIVGGSGAQDNATVSAYVTNTAAQLRQTHINSSGTGTSLVQTNGWIDTRGKWS